MSLFVNILSKYQSTKIMKITTLGVLLYTYFALNFKLEKQAIYSFSLSKIHAHWTVCDEKLMKGGKKSFFSLFLLWRPGIGVGVTQRHCVFKPITWYAKSRATKSIPGLYCPYFRKFAVIRLLAISSFLLHIYYFLLLGKINSQNWGL